MAAVQPAKTLPFNSSSHMGWRCPIIFCVNTSFTFTTSCCIFGVLRKVTFSADAFRPTNSQELVGPTNQLKNWLIARSPHSSVIPCHQRLQPTRGPRSAGGTTFTGLCTERTLEATLFLRRRGGAVWQMRSSKDAQPKSKRWLQWASEDQW